MYFHTAYSLVIQSEFHLPETLVASETEPDVTIRLGKVDHPRPEIVSPEGFYELTPEGSYFFWDQVGAFFVPNQHEIIVDPLPAVSEHIVRLPLLGVVLSAVLQYRGILGLHASAVSLNDQAIAFLGHRGRGKSTLAAALYAQGHPLVGDDLVAIDINQGEKASVHPGFPQLKLMPEAAKAALGDDPTELRQLIPGYEKRAREAFSHFSCQSLSLSYLYVLDEGPTLDIERIQPEEAMFCIMGQSYTARVFRSSLSGRDAAKHFLQCAEVVKRVPVFRFKRPRCLGLLPDAVRLIETHHGVFHHS